MGLGSWPICWLPMPMHKPPEQRGKTRRQKGRNMADRLFGMRGNASGGLGKGGGGCLWAAEQPKTANTEFPYWPYDQYGNSVLVVGMMIEGHGKLGVFWGRHGGWSWGGLGGAWGGAWGEAEEEPGGSKEEAWGEEESLGGGEGTEGLGERATRAWRRGLGGLRWRAGGIVGEVPRWAGGGKGGATCRPGPRWGGQVVLRCPSVAGWASASVLGGWVACCLLATPSRAGGWWARAAGHCTCCPPSSRNTQHAFLQHLIINLCLENGTLDLRLKVNI